MPKLKLEEGLEPPAKISLSPLTRTLNDPRERESDPREGRGKLSVMNKRERNFKVGREERRLQAVES